MLLKSKLWQLILPPKCLLCDRINKASTICKRCMPLQVNADLRCPRCFSPSYSQDQECSLCRLLPSPFRRMRYLWEYTGNAKFLISAMKYRPSPYICNRLSDLAAQSIEELYIERSWDLIVPIPITKSGLYKRGFNQCLSLGLKIQARLAEAQLSNKALYRLRSGKAQASLPHRRRLNNVKNTFAARACEVQDKFILLIDDVATTGATVNQAACALLDQGAAAIDLFTLARSKHWQKFRWELHSKPPTRPQVY